jgi:hypothetical protein
LACDAADAVGIAIVREAILLRVVKVPNTIGKKCSWNFIYG